MPHTLSLLTLVDLLTVALGLISSTIIVLESGTSCTLALAAALPFSSSTNATTTITPTSTIPVTIRPICQVVSPSLDSADEADEADEAGAI